MKLIQVKLIWRSRIPVYGAIESWQGTLAHNSKQEDIIICGHMPPPSLRTESYLGQFRSFNRLNGITCIYESISHQTLQAIASPTLS